ncbi:hypothetical protein ACHAP5_010711 [Fusarium lateritium]
MHYTSILAALSFGVGAHAWAQSGNGEWIANDRYYDINGLHVAEACTYRNTNNVVPNGGGCRYWTNASGGIFNGKCRDIGVILRPARQCVDY